MSEIRFVKKYITNEICKQNDNFKFTVNKPLFCPICSTPQDGKPKTGEVFVGGDDLFYVVVNYECATCGKHYLTISDAYLDKKKAEFSAFYPNIMPNFNNAIIEKLSPRFIDIYNQALACEHNGHIELAAIGFRSALEILIKDYAIIELQKDEKEVCKKKLMDAISAYLDKESVKSADVIRILGNDYTHYKRKYPQHDFEILKTYMGIFINQIQMKLQIAHPPVERQENPTKQGVSPQSSNTEPKA